jgi:hypothetical protein
MKVMHIITRMIVGGAQENTLYNCLDLTDHHGDDVILVTGPSLGAEGNLLQQSQTSRLRVHEVDSLESLLESETFDSRLAAGRSAYTQRESWVARALRSLVHGGTLRDTHRAWCTVSSFPKSTQS